MLITTTELRILSHQKAPVKVYFENLNAIRCIAAFLVVVHHIEALKTRIPIPNYWNNTIILLIGRLGVILFFVLSGFLISFLLFKEQEITKNIAIKNFYIRRILRIWPLYYLIIIATFFIIPFIDFFTIEGFSKDVVWSHLFVKLCLYVMLLPNLVLNLFGSVSYAAQTWSIGAEEQFYLVWPFLMRYVKNKWFLLLGIIIGYLLIKFSFHLLPTNEFVTIFNGYWISTPIHCMAIGGLFALLIYTNSSTSTVIRKLLFTTSTQVVVLATTFLSIAIGFNFPHLNDEFYAILWGILISNFAANANRLFSMENPWSNYMGTISYGLYMFHPLVIVFSIKILQYLNIENDFILYPLVFVILIAVSSLSYEFFEKTFINKKVNYSTILSGANAKV